MDLKSHLKELIPKASRGLDDFEYFCKEILGYKSQKEAKDYFDLTPTHVELIKELETLEKGDKQQMVLMPRHSIKSHIVTIGYSLWRIARDPNIRILIYSDSATKAQQFLYGVKTHLEGKAAGSTFREIYGKWETDPHKGGTWNESKITVKVRRFAQKEPTIDTGGIESSKIGMHYDMMIFDDIVSDLNTTTKSQMDKIHDCYKKSLSLLKPGGDIVIVGTRWHFGDAYGRIIDENKDKSNFKIFSKDAETVVDGKLLFEGIGLNRDFLDYQKREQGSYIYSCLYRNNPVSDETAIFKENDFRFYEPNPSFHENMFITGTCDPAGEGEDFTAITVVGTDNEKNMYILDAVNQKMQPNVIIETIIRLNYKWGFDRFGCERNFFKGMLEKAFREAEQEHRVNPNWKPFSFKEDLIASAKQRTFTRVLSLQPIHERGQLFFPGTSLNTLSPTMSELAFQMVQFTIDGAKSPHDDLIVSLAYHVELSVAGGQATPMRPPKNSVAWLEEQWVGEQNQMQKRLPRHARRTYIRGLS